jgi:hypothetical protein
MISRNPGYYKSHGKKVSKITALEFWSKTGIKPTYHLFEEELDKIDLFVEPAESLDQLYAKRAQQLREKYDYLILAFTGGTDSENVFKTFYKNNIKLDEILHYHYDLRWRDKMIDLMFEPESFEHEKLSMPLLKHIKDNLCPDIKITVEDHTGVSINFYKEMGSGWHEKIGLDSLELFLSPAHAWRSDPSRLNPAWQKLLDSGKRVGLILAKEKLEVKRDDEGWYFQYFDGQNNKWFFPPVLRPDNPMAVELFYTDSTTVEMQIKQAHMIRNAAKTDFILGISSKIETREWENAFARACYGSRILPLPFLGVKEQDFKERYGTKFGNGGPNSRWFMLEESESWNRNWMNGMQDLFNNHMTRAYSDAHDMLFSGLSHIYSKKHYFVLNDA